MRAHRYYVVLEDGEVYWTDNDARARIFSDDGTSIVIDTKLNVTMLDGQTQHIKDIIPENDDDDLDPDDPDGEGDDDDDLDPDDPDGEGDDE